MDKESNKTPKWYDTYGLWLLMAIPIVSCLTYVLISNHVWEDYLITFKFSRNFAEGNGLVYNVGERVHGFTSFFNTIIPAVFDWIIGVESIYPVLWLYRIVSILTLVAALRILVKALTAESPLLSILMVVWIAFEIKVVAFTTNGQEVAFMIFFIACAIYLISKDKLCDWFKVGAVGAGFMYTRPDGFIYALVLFGGAFLFSKDKSWQLWFYLVKAGLVTFMLYSPWFIAMWVYYGSPVPHTAVAKANAYLTIAPHEYWGYIQKVFILTVGHIYKAIYVDHLGNPVSMFWVQWFVGPFLALFWLIPGANRIGRIASLSYLVVCAYLAYAGVRVGGQVFPWYKPAVAALGIVVLITGLKQILPFMMKNTYAKLLWLLPIWFSFFIFYNYIYGTVQLTTHQNIVENQCRKEVGLWIREHAEPGDTGHSEPLGYIGFYSGLRMHDWPGLVSEQSVQARENQNNIRGKVIYEMQPDWLILRPSEFIKCFSQEPKLADLYYRAHVVDVIPILDERPWIPGKRYHYFDAKFYIFHKVQEATVE